MNKREELLLCSLKDLNQHIKDNQLDCPFIDLDTVTSIIKHQERCIVDGMMRLDPVIKIYRLGKFIIKDKRKKKLINKFGNGNEKSFEQRIKEGLFANIKKSNNGT